MASTADSAPRRARAERGLSQSALARQAGISRQALSAIEAGDYQPGVAVALRLARALGSSVEQLFGTQESEPLAASWAGQAPAPGTPPPRVALARIGGKLVAVARPAAALSLTPAAGVVERWGPRHRAEVDAFRSAGEIDSTLLIAGCDPAVAILADHLGRQSPPIGAVALVRNSRAALEALAGGAAHVAGIHLRDPRSGEYNLAAAREILAARRRLVVNFARWELGLATRPGRRPAIRAVEDLARPGVRLINREPGSGARLALDEALSAHRIRPARIDGYRRLAPGHLEVAATIAGGLADAGVTIRVAAEAYGLEFAVWREERYDLVVPQREMQSAPVRAMLEALNSARFAREVSTLCAYDTRDMGRVMARSE